MRWNWQKPDWPEFRWDASRLAPAEERFKLGSGVLLGVVKHVDEAEREQLTIAAMSEEAMTTSEIEGEILERRSVQSSIRRQLGLDHEGTPVRPAEEGIGELMVDLYRDFARPLDEQTLHRWHAMVCKGRNDLRDIGRYRTHTEPMQVVSGAVYAPKVHFEAPPSERVAPEMSRFVGWCNATSPSGGETLPTLTRAGIAHLYFESIHPYEDGNGRVGRAVAEKIIAQGLGRPSLIALASTVLAHRAAYYRALEAASKSNAITDWLAWFAGICLEAQLRTIAHVEFVIDKARLLDRARESLNERQMAALLRVLREGPEGFKGGLSASKYAAITKASAATATRDLADMVDQGVLTRTGERRHTRYHLSIPLRPTPHVTIDARGQIIETPKAT